MRLDDGRESGNVEDRRGESAGGFGLGGKSIGIGGIVLALVVSYFTGISPTTLLGMLPNSGSPTTQSTPAHGPPANDQMGNFVSKVLADTEDTWQVIFREAGREGQRVLPEFRRHHEGAGGYCRPDRLRAGLATIHFRGRWRRPGRSP